MVYDDEMCETLDGEAWVFLGALSDGMADGMGASVVAFLEGGYGRVWEDGRMSETTRDLFAFVSDATYATYAADDATNAAADAAANDDNAAADDDANSSHYNNADDDNANDDDSVYERDYEQDDNADENIEKDGVEKKSNDHLNGKSNREPKTEKTPITNSSASTSPLKNGRSLSIDVNAPKRDSPSKKFPALSLKLSKPINPTSTSNDSLKSPLSEQSPNDVAAPPEPFSIITPNILVGSDQLPSSTSACKQLSDIGVTHILNMAAEIPINPLVLESNLFKVKWIPVYDNTEVDLDDALQSAISFIDEAISGSSSAKVFVHCKAGRSRSVSVVIGYLVTHQKHTLKTAYELVRRVRKGVSPNLGFMAALLKVEKECTDPSLHNPNDI